MSFEPFADPKAVGSPGGRHREPLAVVALVSSLFGGALGVGLHVGMRGVLRAWRRRT